jgi:NAD(P) transhydrogenase subunit alpha
MRLFVPKARYPQETRVALTPLAVEQLVRLGLTVTIEAGLGASLGIEDSSYLASGATMAQSPAEADIVVRLRPPQLEEIKAQRSGSVAVGFFEPFSQIELIKAIADAGLSALCMELIPRTTLAQKMDALSSQANLAGYAAMILAAERIDKVLPMMTTPAGTITPARVFVIGAGVAGLQAIATARRLGARVEAFDTRPAAQEQIASLGAKPLQIDLGETTETKGGYAGELTPEQLARQREAMAKSCAAADIVITTAQVFGKRAPLLVTEAMVAGMRPGSVIIDLAAASGGNVEGTVPDEERLIHGVKIIGLTNLPGKVARDASQMYANNVVALLTHLWDGEAKALHFDLNDEITSGALLVHGGQIRHDEVRALVEGRP